MLKLEDFYYTVVDGRPDFLDPVRNVFSSWYVIQRASLYLRSLQSVSLIQSTWALTRIVWRCVFSTVVDLVSVPNNKL